MSEKAPTDNGIPELDGLCQQYNDGEIDLCTLVCHAWNKALVIDPFPPAESTADRIEKLEAVKAAADRIYTHLTNGGKLDSKTGCYDQLKAALEALK